MLEIFNIHQYLALGIIWTIIATGENLRRYPQAKWWVILLGMVLNFILWPIALGLAIYDVVIKGDSREYKKTETKTNK